MRKVRCTCQPDKMCWNECNKSAKRFAIIYISAGITLLAFLVLFLINQSLK